MNKPGRKLYTGVILLVLASLLAAAASASGLVFSAIAKARVAAEQALCDRYGITRDMLSYFGSYHQNNDDGSLTISYEGIEDLAFVLGRYAVRFADGAVQDVTWSHDGEDTSRGFESIAWGTEQLEEMLRINRATGNMAEFMDRIEEINAENGFVVPEGTIEETDDEAFEKEVRQIRDQSCYSSEELEQMAREAVAELYQLSPEQAGMLITDENGEDLISYRMIDGVPCFRRMLFLVQDPSPDDPYFALTRVEKDGTYIVFINTLTGVIEDAFYDTGAGGNG